MKKLRFILTTFMIVLTFILFFISCTRTLNTPTEINTNAYCYFEDFEKPIVRGENIVVNFTSYYKKLNDGWSAFAEDWYHTDQVDTYFRWVAIYDTLTRSHCIRGETSSFGRGNLWIYKSYKINPNDSVYISVNGRTTKQYYGWTTGPSIYVFEGKIKYPSQISDKLLGWRICRWKYYEQSPWLNLSLNVMPKSDYITVGLKVNDAFDERDLYNEYDKLLILQK